MRVFPAHYHDTTKNAFSDLNSELLCGTLKLYAIKVTTGLAKLQCTQKNLDKMSPESDIKNPAQLVSEYVFLI